MRTASIYVFEQLLAEILEMRIGERLFYQQITDILHLEIVVMLELNLAPRSWRPIARLLGTFTPFGRCIGRRQQPSNVRINRSGHGALIASADSSRPI